MIRPVSALLLLGALTVSPPRLFLGPDSRVALVWGPSVVAAQDITADAAGWRTDQTRTGWRIGIGSMLAGPLGSRLFAEHHTTLNGNSYSSYGVGTDLTLFERGIPGVYFIGGVGGGFRNLGPGTPSKLYGDWSAGLGYEWVPLSFLVIRGEGRWREQRPGPERGLELSVGTAIRFNVSRAPHQRAYTEERRMAAPSAGHVVDLATAEGIGRDRAEVLSGVVETATGAMGTPYQWGGTGASSGGFDCSGLIQYAYRQHGIQLPRTSADQARVGVAVPKRLDALAPGDILTFSNSGGHVTHVALYVGDRKIIHSANGGVQMSLLSPNDSYGKWWWERWVGVRRVVK